MHRRWQSPISGAGEVPANPEKASYSSSDEYDDGCHCRNEPVHKRRRKVLVVEDDDDDDENEVGVARDEGESATSGSNEDEEEEEDENARVAKPIGDVVRVSGSGERKVNHYKAFEYAGYCFKLEDPVLMSPDDETQKPYVAIIKDITHNISNGEVMLTGQSFYRPEEAKKKEGGSWKACDTRELFYSFHQKEFAAQTVLHTCVVNFVPLHNQLPDRKRYPGFIIQKVYDTERKKLFSLTDKDFEDTKQSEIDCLVNKTMARLGYVPAGLDIEDIPPVDVEKEVLTKGNTLLRKRNLSPTDELKEGLTAEEIARNKPKDSTRVQMLDVRCKRCSERKVSRASIIKAGTERYELVCMACRFSWYISREQAATLNYELSTIKKKGTAPLDSTKLKIAGEKCWAASLHQR